jgi:hypothetical protein
MYTYTVSFLQAITQAERLGISSSQVGQVGPLHNG